MAETAVDVHLQHRIEQFLFHEAELLDARQWRAWYALMADDLRYFMPLRTNRTNKDIAKEFSASNEMALFDETKTSLDMRIRRLESGMAWAEDPPSRTRHLITNVRAALTDDPREIRVRAYFHVYRSRLERQVDQFVGEREDILRSSGANFVIARRTIYLDQTTVLANNLSMFF